MNKEQFNKLYLGMPVHCPTEELAKEFLELAYSFGFFWVDKYSSTRWSAYKKYTYYRLNDNGVITYGDIMALSAFEIAIEFKSLKPEFKIGDMAISDLEPVELEKNLFQSIKYVSYVTKDNLPKLILEALDMKIGERFKLKQCGDAKFFFDENLNAVNTETGKYVKGLLRKLIVGEREIDKIIKIKKPLLTDEEIKILKTFDFDLLEKNENLLSLYEKWEEDGWDTIHYINLDKFKHKFLGLDYGVEYTREELGI